MDASVASTVLDDHDGSTYLTDGERLYRVLRAWRPNGQVLLEDAGDPSLPAVVVNVQDLVRDRFSVVVPAG